MFLEIESAREKTEKAADRFHAALQGISFEIDCPGRDVPVVLISQMPPRPGLSLREGQTRLLHDIANIELQAMELAFRTLVEFPDAPPELRRELADLGISEARHLQMCLDGLERMGEPWGTYPVSLMLWETVAPDDDLLDRLLIVHRYLEGGGLDASARILRRMNGTRDFGISKIIEQILREEIDHVSFGSRWFHRLQDVQNPDQDLSARLLKLEYRLPRRLEKIDRELRLKAGFTHRELEIIEEFQNQRRGSSPSILPDRSPVSLS